MESVSMKIEGQLPSWKTPNLDFWKFINSLLNSHMLIFIAAILTVILLLVLIYIITGQSKLRALISTIALYKELEPWKSSVQINQFKTAIQDY